MIRVISLYMVLSLVISGCNLFKTNRTPIELIKTVDIDVPTNKNFRVGEWPSYNWWSIFDDSQLSEIIEVAIRSNPTLKASMIRVSSAKADAMLERSAMLPKIDMNFTDKYGHMSKNSLGGLQPPKSESNVVDLSLNFKYEIDIFGKDINRYRSYLSKERSKRAEMSQSMLILTINLAKTYFDYLSIIAKLDLVKKLALEYENYIEIATKRDSYGLDNVITLDLAKTNLINTKEKIASLEQNRSTIESQIKILMGSGPNENIKLKLSNMVFDKPFSIPENIPVDFLSRRPDLMSKIWMVESCANMIGAAKAAFFPNINILALTGLETANWKNIFSSDSSKCFISPAINLPIFIGGKLRANLDKAYYDFDAMICEYNSLILNAAKEVSDNIKIFQQISIKEDLQKEAISRYENIYKITKARYKNGIDDYLKVINSKITTFNSYIEGLEIKNNKYAAILNLIKSLGGGYRCDGKY